MNIKIKNVILSVFVFFTLGICKSESPRKVIPYHGMRLPPETTEFYVKRIYSQFVKEGEEKKFPPRPDFTQQNESNQNKNEQNQMNKKDFPPPPPPEPKDEKNYRQKYYDEDAFEITVFFSLPVDPRTLTKDSFLLNGKKFSDEIRFEYNRAGNILRISILNSDKNEYSSEFSIEFTQLKSYNQKNLVQTKFEKITDSYYSYSE